MRSHFFAVALSMFAISASASLGPEVVAAKVAAVKAKADAAAAPATATPMVSAISTAIKESF